MSKFETQLLVFFHSWKGTREFSISTSPIEKSGPARWGEAEKEGREENLASTAAT